MFYELNLLLLICHLSSQSIILSHANYFLLPIFVYLFLKLFHLSIHSFSHFIIFFINFYFRSYSIIKELFSKLNFLRIFHIQIIQDLTAVCSLSLTYIYLSLTINFFWYQNIPIHWLYIIRIKLFFIRICQKTLGIFTKPYIFYLFFYDLIVQQYFYFLLFYFELYSINFIFILL
jgi:hypothetical protein